jgi:hypothetical protein
LKTWVPIWVGIPDRCLQPLALLIADANKAGCSLDIPLEDESIRFQANSLRHDSAGHVSIHYALRAQSSPGGEKTFSNRDASQEADNENAQVHVVSLGESLG